MSRIIESLKKLFVKKRKTNTSLNELSIIEYYDDTQKYIAKLCNDGGIDYLSARCYFRHIPLRYDPSNDFPEEVNAVVDKIFKTLYDGCIKNNIIAPNISYEDFYKGKGLYDESYPLDKILNRK